MKKKCYIVAIVWISLTIVGCTTHCDPFPEEMKAFSPYEEGETLAFRSSHGDTLLLVCNYTNFYRGDTELEWNCKCACESWIEHLLEGNGVAISPMIHFYDNKSLIYRAQCGASLYGEQSYFDVEKPLDAWRNMDTLLLAAGSQRFDSLLVVKGVGIVGFVDSERGRYTRI